MKTIQMKVCMSGYFNGEYLSLAKGDTINLPTAEADRLIAAGYAQLPISQAAASLSTLAL